MKKTVNKKSLGTQVLGVVDRETIAFIPKDMTEKELIGVVDLLAKYLLQNSQLDLIRKLMPQQDE